MWRLVKGTGLERFELIQDSTGWTLHGTVLALAQRGPAAAIYTVSCDAEWRTLSAVISLADDSGNHALRIAASHGHWRVNGEEAKHLAGCIDIDLGWSPSTNTIAIRRLNLPIAARSTPMTVAWVRFPELTVEPLKQEYERIGAHRYRYTSRGGGFRAAIDVDADALVTEYEGVWQRVLG